MSDQNQAASPTEAKKTTALAPLRMGERGIKVKDWNEVYRLAHAVLEGGMAPQSFKTINQIATAMMMGMELGLPPMGALRTIAVVKGTPSVWGKGGYALAMDHPLYEDHEVTWQVGDGEETEFPPEYSKPEDVPDTLRCICRVWRKGAKKPKGQKFSVADAKIAGLWLMKSSSGAAMPWTSYWSQMMYHKAVGNALEMAIPEAFIGMLNAPVQEVERITTEQEEEANRINTLPDRPTTLTKPADHIVDAEYTVTPDKPAEQDPGQMVHKLVLFDELKKKHPNAVLFFRTGSNYEAYQQDARSIAKLLDLKVEQRGKTEVCIMSDSFLEDDVKKITAAGITLAICEPNVPANIITPPAPAETKKRKTEKQTINPQDAAPTTPSEEPATVNQILKEFRESCPQHQAVRMSQDEEARYVNCDCGGRWKFEPVGAVMTFPIVKKGNGSCETEKKPVVPATYTPPDEPGTGLTATNGALSREIAEGNKTDVADVWELLAKKLKSTKEPAAVAEVQYLAELAIVRFLELDSSGSGITRVSGWVNDVKAKLPEERVECLRVLVRSKNKSHAQ
jgi:hypothetical protein